MDRPKDSQKPIRSGRRDAPSSDSGSLSYRTLYLISYNSISAVLWYIVLWRVLLTASTFGYEHVYASVGEFTKWTQTLALLEVVHSVAGMTFRALLQPLAATYFSSLRLLPLQVLSVPRS